MTIVYGNKDDGVSPPYDKMTDRTDNYRKNIYSKKILEFLESIEDLLFLCEESIYIKILHEILNIKMY
jgi:hypothetical protein